MRKNAYSNEVKWAVVKDKMSGQFTNQEIMDKYGIKNVSQIKTWMKWYRENQVYRFDQPLGRQYTYGHGPDSSSEEEKLPQRLPLILGEPGRATGNIRTFINLIQI